jgi:hypothetical protein
MVNVVIRRVGSFVFGVWIVMLAWWGVAREFPVFGLAAAIVAVAGIAVGIVSGAPVWLTVLAAPIALLLCCAMLYSVWLVAVTISPPDFP